MVNAISGLFGKKPQQPAAPAAQPLRITAKDTEGARNETLARLAKLRYATRKSDLSQPNVKRKTLGAGI